MVYRSVGAVLGLVAATAQLAAGQSSDPLPLGLATTLNSWWGNPQQKYPTTVKWAEVLYGPGDSRGYKMWADHDGNVISSGRFSRWVSFGPYNLTDSSGNNAAWIVKQGPEGEYLWAKTVTMSTASNAIVRGLRTDKDGNIYLVMDAAGTATIGGMSETVAGTVLVAKLSPSGQPTWLESLGDGALTVQGSAVDPTGQFHYVVGVSSQSSINLGGNTFTRVGSNTNMYLVKMLTADGSVQWARQYAASGGSMSASSGPAIDSLDVDSAGNVYIGSFFSGTIDTGLGSFSLTSAGGNDPFVVKVSSSGTTLGAFSFGTFGNEQASAIRVGPQDTIYLLGRGQFDMTVPTTPPTNFVSSAGDWYIWLVTLDSSLAAQKAKQYGTRNGNPYEAQLAVDKEGNAYLAGDFQRTIIGFGDQVVNNHALASDEIYLAKVEPSALDVVWLRSFGGSRTDEALAVAVNDRYIFFTGTMRTDYSSGVVTAPNYFDEYVLVGYSGSDQPFLAMVYAAGSGGTCSNLGLVKLQASKRAVAGRPMRVQVAVRNRGTATAHKTRALKYHKNANTAPSDCEGLLVTVTLPAGLTYLPGKTTRSAKASAYNATMADGVLTWRGPAPANGKTQKLQAQFTVAGSAETGPVYFTASAQCLDSAGNPTCTTLETPAEVMVKGAKAAKL